MSFNWGSFGEIFRLGGMYIAFSVMCTFSHEVELLLNIEPILGEQGGVGIVRTRLRLTWGSFVDILRLGGMYIVFFGIFTFSHEV